MNQRNRNKMKGAIPKDPNRSTFSTASAASNSDQLDSSQESEVVKNTPVFQGKVSKNSHFKHNNVIPQTQETYVISQDQESSAISQDNITICNTTRSSAIAQDQGTSNNVSYQPWTNLDETLNTEKPAIHHQFWNFDILSSNELKCVRKENLKYGKYLHTNCHSCESYYSTSHPPYLQKCGISVCSICNNKIEIECDYCNSNCDQKSTSQNKDLLNNSQLLLSAFNNLNLLETEDKFIDPDTCEETLFGLDQFESKFINLKQEIQNGLNELKSNLLDFEKNFCYVKENLNNLMSPRLKMESMSPSLLSDWRKMLKFTIWVELSRNVDNALYCLLKAIQTSDIQIGLRVKNFSVRDLDVDSNLTKFFFFALLEKYENRQYYPFVLYKNLCYIGTHKNSDELEAKNIFVIDYESLKRDCSECGIFLEIENEVNEKRVIEIKFCCEINGSLKEQLVLLCSGEEGPCYVGGNVVVDENGLLINSYADEGLGCDGSIQSIPDNVGYFDVPDVLDVSVTREFGCEACLCITRNVINESANIVGRVFNPLNLNDIQEGEWIIANSGWIMPL